MLEKNLHIVVDDKSLRAIESSIAQLKLLIENWKTVETAIGDWIPEDEVLRISQLGKTSLYNLRKSGKLSSSTISGRGVFYRKSDLERLLNNNEKRCTNE